MPEALFAIAGHGAERPRLEKLVEEGALSKSVRFMGSRKDVAEILNAADCLVLVSVTEGFPRVVAEAFAAGAPVVCTPAPGTLDIVREGENGLVVPFRDPASVARAILRTLRFPAETAQRRERARRDVRKHDLDTWVRGAERVFDRAIAARGERLAAYLADAALPSPLTLHWRFRMFRLALRLAVLLGRTPVAPDDLT